MSASKSVKIRCARRTTSKSRCPLRPKVAEASGPWPRESLLRSSNETFAASDRRWRAFLRFWITPSADELNVTAVRLKAQVDPRFAKHLRNLAQKAHMDGLFEDRLRGLGLYDRENATRAKPPAALDWIALDAASRVDQTAWLSNGRQEDHLTTPYCGASKAQIARVEDDVRTALANVARACVATENLACGNDAARNDPSARRSKQTWIAIDQNLAKFTLKQRLKAATQAASPSPQRNATALLAAKRAARAELARTRDSRNS